MSEDDENEMWRWRSTSVVARAHMIQACVHSEACSPCAGDQNLSWSLRRGAMQCRGWLARLSELCERKWQVGVIGRVLAVGDRGARSKEYTIARRPHFTAGTTSAARRRAARRAAAARGAAPAGRPRGRTDERVAAIAPTARVRFSKTLALHCNKHAREGDHDCLGCGPA